MLVANISGMMGSAISATCTYIGEGQTSSGTSPITFSGIGIGTAAADRFVIVAVYAIDNTNGTIASVTTTLGGNAMTELHHTQDATHKNATYIYGLTVPSGTTADLIVTFSEGLDGISYAVWTATGLQSTTPTDTGGDNTASAGTLTDTLNVLSGGIVIGVGSTDAAGSVRTHTWSGPTEDYDVGADGNSDCWSGAHANVATGSAAYTVSVTPSVASANQHLTCISMR